MLTKQERASLELMLHCGQHATRKLTRARILLKADAGLDDQAIADEVQTSRLSVERTRRRFTVEWLAALAERPRPGRTPKLDEKGEARLIAEACSAAPESRQCWTLQLLAQRVVALQLSATCSRDTVRRTLKKTNCNSGVNSNGASRKLMVRLSPLWKTCSTFTPNPMDPKRPKVNFDQTSRQLLADVSDELPPAPGRPARVDNEYARHGTRNLFIHCEPQARWRHVTVTERRTKHDSPQQMKWLVDEQYLDAGVIRIVIDNLNTHGPGSLYGAFAPAEAFRLMRKLEFHYTLKHGSWLNKAEVELSILQRQCLQRRIAGEQTLQREVTSWEQQRNAALTGDRACSLEYRKCAALRARRYLPPRPLPAEVRCGGASASVMVSDDLCKWQP